MLVVIKFPWIEKSVPVKEMGPAAVKFWKVERPCPLVWVIEPALTFDSVIALPLAKVKAPVMFTLPATEILPLIPALSVKLPAPETALNREIFVPAAAVFKTALPLAVRGLAN